jgi:hypothetical protein
MKDSAPCSSSGGGGGGGGGLFNEISYIKYDIIPK